MELGSSSRTKTSSSHHSGEMHPSMSSGVLRSQTQHSFGATALVIVAPSGLLCDVKLQHWKEWAADVPSFGVEMHLLVDDTTYQLPPSY